MTLAPSVFEYTSAKRFLIDYVAFRQREDSAFSLRKWAAEMGMKSHALIVMILQGKRSLTLKQVPCLSKGLGLSSPERLYFQALIQLEQARTEEEKNLCRLWLAEIHPGRDFRIREVDEYLAISHWTHMAVLAMTDLNGFQGTPEEIHQRLGRRIPIHEVRSVLERLKALDLLKEEEDPVSGAKRLRCTYARVTTRDDVANRGAREYHKQVAALVPDAIENQPVDLREFQSFAVSVPKSRVPLAKEMIRKFRTQFYEAMTREPGDEVYQTSIQFFRLTESPSPARQAQGKEDEGAGRKSNPPRPDDRAASV